MRGLGFEGLVLNHFIVKKSTYSFPTKKGYNNIKELEFH